MLKDKCNKLKIRDVKIHNTSQKIYERFPGEGISQFFITKSSLYNNMEFIFDDWVELSEKNYEGNPLFYKDKKNDVTTYFTHTELHQNTCVVDYRKDKEYRKIFIFMSGWALSNFLKDKYIIEYFEKDKNKSSTFLGELITQNEKIVLSDVLNYVEVDVPDGCHKIYGYELRKLDLSHGFCIEINEKNEF